MKQAVRTGVACLFVGGLVGAIGCSGESAPPPANPEALLDPMSPDMNVAAPATFQARFETSKGAFVIEVHRQWSPNGADRFYNLVRNGFFTDVRFFRVMDGFMAQFGIHGDPELQGHWRDSNIPDDPVIESNTRGRLTFATGGPNSRSTQLFINFADNTRLDGMGFSPLGEVIEGMEVVDQIHSGYGDSPPRGVGPSQGRLQAEGNAYLIEEFAELDYIERAEIVEGS